MLWIHIAGGLVALVGGYVALYTRKGAAAHRAAGRAFACAMFVMTISGALVATLSSPNPGNVLVAATTFYLVATGWLAVRPGVEGARRRHVALASFGVLTGVCGASLATVAFDRPGDEIAGIPAAAMAVFASIVLLASAADWRALNVQAPGGRARLIRHLWRMGLALWIATISFFFGQADEFPAAVRQTGVLYVPVAAVALTLLYWLFRQWFLVWRAWRARLAPSAADRALPG